MNKRIRKLADEADEYTKQTVHYYQGQFNGLTWEGKIKQTRDTKFAELIVRECAIIADTERSNSVGCGYITKTNGMRIKEHFGVEQ